MAKLVFEFFQGYPMDVLCPDTLLGFVQNLPKLQQFYSNRRRKFMNQVTHHDFGLFETELLSVDFIRFNSQRITSHQRTSLAS